MLAGSGYVTLECTVRTTLGLYEKSKTAVLGVCVHFSFPNLGLDEVMRF